MDKNSHQDATEDNLRKLPEQPDKQQRYSFLHRLVQSTRAAVFVAIGTVLGGLAGCSDKNPAPETQESPATTQPTDGKTPDDTNPAKIDITIKDTVEEIKDACAKEEPKSVVEKLQCATSGFLEPDHPQSAIGYFSNIKDLQQYDADYRPVSQAWDAVKNQRKRLADKKIKPNAKKTMRENLNRLIEKAQQLQRNFDEKYRGRHPGKIAIFQRQPLTALKHIAIGEFLEDAIDEGCSKAGLTRDECLLYHVILFENSGGLWKGSPAGAVGPSQIIFRWFEWQKTLMDGLKTENFWVEPGFDGRYDPIANIEMGARILKQEIKNFGRERPDFAVLAYNQGSGHVKDFVYEWAKKHRPGIPGSNYKNIKNWPEFLNQINATVAEMLMDKELSKKKMPTNNGGRGYLSKILAMQMIAADSAGFGIERRAVEILPAATDAEGKVLYKWNEGFYPSEMPAGESLREFAERQRLNLGQLAFLNQQIRNVDARFSRPARIWILRNSAPVPPKLAKKMTRKVPFFKKHPVKNPLQKIRKKSRRGKFA